MDCGCIHFSQYYETVHWVGEQLVKHPDILNDGAEIAELIAQTTATPNPFDKNYSKAEDTAWETCASVLNRISVRELMEAGWG